MPAWSEIIQVTGWVVLAIGVLLVAWALAWDLVRMRGPRRRCPRCWYDMRSVPGLTCPECGRAARDEKGLTRRRRRWWAAVLGLFVAAVGLAGTQQGPIAQGAWERWIPSWCLVRLVEDPATPPDMAWGTAKRLRIEMLRRYTAGRFSAADKRILAAKQFALQEPMLIAGRSAWPEGVPVVVSFAPAISGPLPRELRARARFPGGVELAASSGGQDDRSNWILVKIGTPPSGTTEVTFDAEVTEGGQVLWSGAVTTPIKVSGAVEEVLTPQVSRSLDDQVRGAVETGLRLSKDGRRAALRRVARDDVTLALDVEVLDGDQPVARAVFVFNRMSDQDRKENYFFRESDEGSWHALQKLSDAFTGADPADPRWRVRVRGDGAAALTDFAATNYWSGEFTIDLPGP